MLFEDANTVTLIPRGANGNIVQLCECEVKLTVCDADGHSVGSSSVAINDDSSVVMTFGNLTMPQPVLTVYVRNKALQRWTSRPLVSQNVLFACILRRFTYITAYRLHGVRTYMHRYRGIHRYRGVPTFWTNGSVCCACTQKPDLPRACHPG